jgi:oxygen-independent coproporphyrinogen-3 oxidase
MPSKTRLARNTSRFYNYPPSLPLVNAKEIFEKKEIALYIHLPFCKKLCYFCPYTKYFVKGKIVNQYLAALKKEMQLISLQKTVQNTVVSSVFFGGGTPTYLSGESLSELLFLCRKHFNLSEDCQITLEANPSTVNKRKLVQLRKAGFNRISFGVQSFSDKFLKMLGTSHNSRQAIKAVKSSLNAGFTNLNIDLMYRLPGQRIEDWKIDLNTALSLNVTHITTYALDIVPGTVLFVLDKENELERIPSIKEEEKMVRLSEEILAKKGFTRYLVDQFSLQNKQNRYAVQTISGEVLGLGCGAFSHFNGFEYRNHTNLREYIKRINAGDFAVERGKKLSKREEMERYIIKHLLFLNVNLEDFKEKFGVNLQQVFGSQLRALESQKLLSVGENAITLSLKGKLYIYDVCRQFYSRHYRKIIRDFEAQIKKRKK